MYNENESRNTENVARFEALMAQVNREGITELMDYIRKSDFTRPRFYKISLELQGAAYCSIALTCTIVYRQRRKAAPGAAF